MIRRLRVQSVGLKLFADKMETYWDAIPIHVIDFEGGPQCGIVEFGVVSIKGASIQSVSSRLCRPTRKIPSREQAVHGISSRMAESQSSFKEEWGRFAALRETGPMAAHFASAESSMLRSVFPYPRSSPSWFDGEKRVVSWGPWIDTGILYRGLGYENESNKLQDLVRRYGLQAELDELAAAYCPEGRRGYHCALYDAIASALLLINYCQNLPDETVPLAKLIAHSQGNSAKRQEVEQRELF
ncbi:MAG TPA: 3'-5' exonuclease [Opitutae bacterium]|nr:3'-5' exonuclease [Opitutae bacterium]